VAEDLNEQQARALVQQHLDMTDIRGGDSWVITDVQEADWGWVIYWTSRRADKRTRIGPGSREGEGPYLVDRHSGRVAMCGSAYPVQQYVDSWRRGQWPDEPAQGRDSLPGSWFDLRPRHGYSAERLAMTAELSRELVPGHVLHGEHAEPLAKCGHCDSVIYELPARRFALVHLTWAHGPEQPPWPQTAVFTSWTAALEAMGEHTT